MVDLAIVIVSYNVWADLERCLRSLRDHPPACSHEIIVVDNWSADGTPDRLREGWPSVRLMALRENAGFARANNLAIRGSASDLILCLNSDTVVPAGAIDRLVAALRRQPDTAAIGPRLVDETGWPELSFGKMLGPFNELRQKLIVALHARHFAPVSHLVSRLTRRERTVDWVSGACLLVRRSEAEVAGLFDERFFLYAEDVDFCAALRALGRAVRFSPVAEVVHYRGRSRAFAADASERAYRRSQLAFYAKHHPAWLPWLRLYLRLGNKVPRMTRCAYRD